MTKLERAENKVEDLRAFALENFSESQLKSSERRIGVWRRAYSAACWELQALDAHNINLPSFISI